MQFLFGVEEQDETARRFEVVCNKSEGLQEPVPDRPTVITYQGLQQTTDLRDCLQELPPPLPVSGGPPDESPPRQIVDVQQFLHQFEEFVVRRVRRGEPREQVEAWNGGRCEAVGEFQEKDALPGPCVSR